MDSTDRAIELKPLVKFCPGKEVTDATERHYQEQMKAAVFVPGDCGVFSGGVLEQRITQGMLKHAANHMDKVAHAAIDAEVQRVASALERHFVSLRHMSPIANQRVEKL